MLDPKAAKAMADKFLDSMPPAIRSAHEKMQENSQAWLTAACQEMNLVTAEEFEVQQKVLAKTRAKLEALEKRVAEIEGGTQHMPTSAQGDSEGE